MNVSAPWLPFRILCVDDNQDCADSTVLLLRLVGFEAQACYDGTTALFLANEFRPNVCLLDLNMVGMDGDEVAKRLHSLPCCPTWLVALTAMNNEESRARTAAAGFHLHLVKPVIPEKLIDVVNALFQQVVSAESGQIPTGNDLPTAEK